jgi:preprotein translocase subunit SecG
MRSVVVVVVVVVVVMMKGQRGDNNAAGVAEGSYYSIVGTQLAAAAVYRHRRALRRWVA